MDIEIRPITYEERPEWVHAAETAFSSVAKEDEVEAWLPVIEPDRSFAAIDGGRIVGTSGAITFRMMVPGGAMIPTAGITAVGVHPTHRRRGINTGMMRLLLDQAAERGEPLAALFASEGAIYGRFGYGLAGMFGEFEAESARMAFVRGYQPSGHVELVSKDDALPVIDEVYEASMRPGGVERNQVLRDHSFATVGEDKDRPWMYAIHRDEAGQADAYAVYWMKHEWPRSVPSGKITVGECVGATPSGNADIWRYLFDIDLVATVEAWNRPADEPLLQLVREPRRLRFSINDGLWIRLLDVVAALEARRYRTDGRIVFEIADLFRPENDGRYELAVEGGTGRCARIDDDADLAGTINMLGATYLGGASFRQLWWASQVDERTAGSVERADAMFASTPAPWCVVDF
ncbi:MAG TPA: GNAT family N-acetyltransferase [Actinomycetota bacterium]